VVAMRDGGILFGKEQARKHLCGTREGVEFGGSVVAKEPVNAWPLLVEWRQACGMSVGTWCNQDEENDSNDDDIESDDDEPLVVKVVRDLETLFREKRNSEKRKRQRTEKVSEEEVEVCEVDMKAEGAKVGHKKKRLRLDRMPTEEQRKESDEVVEAGLTEEEEKAGLLIVYFAGGRVAMKQVQRKVHYFKECQYLNPKGNFVGLARKMLEKVASAEGNGWKQCGRCANRKDPILVRD
jgi:hypothetical protein